MTRINYTKNTTYFDLDINDHISFDHFYVCEHFYFLRNKFLQNYYFGNYISVRCLRENDVEFNPIVMSAARRLRFEYFLRS